MNKITIRTVTQGYVIETEDRPENYPMIYAAETVEKVKEIIELLLVVEREEKPYMASIQTEKNKIHWLEDETILDGCRHEWEASSNSASGYKCRLCGAFRAY